MQTRSKTGDLPGLPNRYVPAQSVLSPSRKRKPCAPSAVEQDEHDFLAALYRDIEVAASSDDLFDDADIQRLIRRARLAQFLFILNGPVISNIIADLGPSTSKPVRSGTVSLLIQDIGSLNSLECTRLKTFYWEVGALIMTACVCSATFRARLRQADSNISNSLTWARTVQLIRERVHSIEFFVRSRDFPWQDLLNDHNAHYSTLLSRQDRLRPHLDAQQRTLITSTNLGIPQRLLLHTLQGPVHPHEWALSATPSTAGRLQLNYTATTDMLTIAPTDAPVGVARSSIQVNIDMARVLTNYPWTHRYQWPQGNDDPRYCGGESDPCRICDTTQEWCKYATRAKPQSVRRSCSHSVDEIKQELGLVTPVLIELIRTRCGAGVRALQDVPKGTYLAEYVGEIYPNILPGTTHHRYGGEEGKSYRYKREFNIRRGRIGKKTKGKKIKHVAEALTGDESKGYWIDPAIYGNWTRYLNHCCEPNTRFDEVCTGQQQLTLIQSQTDILFGEELTISYSDDYFDGKSFRCKCGAAKCQMWESGQTGKGSGTTLESAIRNQDVEAVAFAAQYPSIPANMAASQPASGSVKSASPTGKQSSRSKRLLPKASAAAYMHRGGRLRGG